MPTAVHALAHCPLTVDAVAELVALPFVPLADEDDDTVEEELRRRGWQWEAELVRDSFRTGYGHVLCSEGFSPFGIRKDRAFLVFGEVYPADPQDASMANATWLNGYMDGWERAPGWRSRRPATDQDCEAVLAQAARAVTEALGADPERTLVSDHTVGFGLALTHRIWRTPSHALILGPSSDEGPYGYLTHLQLSQTPLSCAPGLPPAGAEHEEALEIWITAHIDW
ncbi:hypothetical protein [Streptomyces misionensis]|uniref:hypothetical protein n=1 Tax=Streptomyces misionensis TaxID=67331 RepID=UPI0036A29119